MATRFVRVDLAEDAVDFRPIAIEPGVPLLDTAGANDKIMFRWLGSLIAEPEWIEDTNSFNFFVRDEQGGRLEEATVELVAEGDLEGPLAGQVEQIRERLNSAKAFSGAEEMMLRLVKAQFNEIIDTPDYPGRLAFFFKYKDANDNLRLVWAYGYQRSDEEIGKPIICDDPECMQLYIQRPNAPKRCPGCQAMPWTRKKRMDAMKRKVRWGFLLLLLLCALGWMLYNTLFALKVNPQPVIVPVGATVDFQVSKPGMFNLGLILAGDVSAEAQTQVADTRVMYFTDGLKAFAQSPGKTQVTFFAAGRKKTVDVEVVPPVMPAKVRLEPEKAELAVGSTVQFKLIGEYEDGSTADLSQACVWKSKNDDTIYHFNGFVEGLAEGTSSVVCQYRASAKDQYIDATAEVSVTPEAFQNVKVTVTPQNIPLGMNGKISVTAQTASGKTVNLTGSSLLDWSIDPPQVAQYKGSVLKTLNVGGGAVKLRMGDQSADCSFTVTEGSGQGTLRVSPTEVSMHVDELLPLSICGPAGSPVKVMSRNLKVVGVDEQGRLIGRTAGTADVVVKVGSEEATVKVTVVEGKVTSIAAFPPEIAVPIDHAVPAKILALSANGMYFSLAPERVSVDTKPSTRFAEVDNSLMIKGYESASAQPLVMNYRGITANAPVSVIPAPQRLKITPEGQVKLPLGLCMSFDGWATYGDGVIARVPYTRIGWQNEPAELDGFAFKGGKAMALKPGVGPVAIWGSYYGSTSNRVELTTSERADVTLKLDVDRNIRVQGESGRAILTGYSPTLGDVELVPELAQYKSSDDKILKPNNPTSDVYTAILPGKAALSATHIAAEKPAAVDLSIVAGRDATLRWEKDSVKLAVDQAVENKLFLDAKLGDDDKVTSVEMTTGAQFKVERPDAVYWQAPILFGQAAAEPFKMTASYIPYIKGSAECTVEVAEAAVPSEIKIVPQYIKGNPGAGSAVSLAVEELLTGDSEFKEIEPSAVAWDVPSGVYWTPAGIGTRPQIVFPADASGAYTVQARYAGKAASVTLTADKSTLDPNDPEVELVVKRYPPGVFVPENSSQAYSIVLKKGDKEELATNVQWGPNYDSEFVQWNAPVLTALKPNYLHWMEAKVGNRSVRWYAQTCDLYAEGMKREAEPGQPTSVQLLCDQGDEVNVPVGAKFTDFRVVAKFGKRTKLVTAKATFYATGDKKSSTPNNGAIEALAPGSATYTAEYMGVESEEKIKVNVVAELDIDSMKLIPDKEIRLLTNNGEFATLDAEGFKNGKSVGLITSFPNLKWTSSDPNVATMQANKALGKAIGKANVTANINNVTSSPAEVEVVATIQEQFGPVESIVNMRVGESRVLGKDVAIVRGNTDFSKMCTVVSGNPTCVEYNAAMNAIVGKAPGVSVVTFLMGDKKAHVTAIVKGLTDEELKDIQENGEILIEPAAATISVGQALEPRVYVVTPSGLKIDRTASAVFNSSDKATAEIRGFQACGLKPGSATIAATIPELMVKKVRGNCQLTVDNNPITELVVEPGALAMSVGDTRNLFIQGKSAAGLYPMFAQADLKVTTDSPSAVMQGLRTVSAVQEGQANVNVTYKTTNAKVPVTVTNDPFENLAIDPPAPTIAVGESMRFQVTAMRGGRLHVVTEADGLKFYTADPKVAAASKDCAVLGVSEGRTVAVAELGTLKTDASVTVVPPGVNGGVINNIETGGVGYGSTYVGDAPALVDIVDGEYIVGADGTHLDIGTYVDDHGVLVENGLDLVNEVGVAHAGELVGLKFIPDLARIAGVGASQPVQVYEYYSDGSLGRDVTADPALQLTAPKNADWTQATGGGKLLVGKALGNGSAEATLGSLGSISPLAVQVGGMTENSGVLVVQPQQLSLIQGESRTLDAVQIAPDSGLVPFDVAYRISAVDNNGIIQVDPNTNTITGLQPGAAQVKVETVDPNGMNDSRVAYVHVDVSTPPNYTITPQDVVLQIGQSTPSFIVSATDPTTGQSFPAPATFTADDPNILAPDPADPSRFIARSMGATQVQATVNGRSAGFAKVSVSGQRFLSVEQTGDPNTTADGFTMTIAATGAASAGALEYRVYMQGQEPSGTWVPAQPAGESQTATMVTPILPHKPLGSQYTLIIESRTAGGADVQQYPFNFRTGMNIQRLNQ